MGRLLFSLSMLVFVACASAPAVDMTEPKRVLGRENDVRIDAQIYGDDVLTNSSHVKIVYEVENLRPESILIADLVPDPTFDEETQTITLALGSEVPGNQFVPRLIEIKPGERKSFTAATRIHIVTSPSAPRARHPRFLRLRLNFLNDVEPFAQLVGIPERTVADAALADALFPKWVESNEVIYTNDIPITWRAAAATDFLDSSRRR